MRAVTRLTPGIISDYSGVAPARFGAEDYFKDLVGLFLPAGTGAAYNYLPDIRNLGYGPSFAGNVSRTSRWDNGPASTGVRPAADEVGAYWDFQNASSTHAYGIASSSQSNIPWQMTSGGAYQPFTMMVVVKRVAALGGSGYETLFAIANYFSNSPSIALSMAKGTGELSGYVALSSGIGFGTGGTSPLGRPVVMFITTRANNDHELYCRDLVTAQEFTATSSTAQSTTTVTAPGAFAIGQYPALSQADHVRINRIYVAACWNRGFTREEMRRIDPFKLMRPSIGRVPVTDVASEVTGDLAATLDVVSLTATGDVPAVGTLATTLGTVTLDATGTVPPTGVLAETLGAVSLDAVGEVARIGTLSETLGGVALSAAGQVGDGVLGILGDAAEQLGAVTLTAEGTVERYGDLAVTLGAVDLAAIGIAGTNGPFTRRPFLVLN